MGKGKIKAFVITRRDFIKMTMAGAAALGLSPLLSWPKLAEALDKKPAVVWLEGQDCAGCTESVLSCLQPDLRDVVLDVVNIRYHETIMAGSGDVAEYALDAAIDEGGYVLVVEGSLPATDGRYLEVAGEVLEAKFVEAAGAAAAIIAIGACATYGGIPRAGVPDGQGVDYFLAKHGISKPLINLPGCPVHPAWFFDTVLYYLNNEGAVPPLDDFKRPLLHFAATVHDTCSRRKFYNKGKYLTDWNNPMERKWCLLLKGCKGTVTYADCPLIKWNEGASYCIDNNAPCAGCTEPAFYEGLSPLFKQTVT
jgi:hydrogenase small subunit